MIRSIFESEAPCCKDILIRLPETKAVALIQNPGGMAKIKSWADSVRVDGRFDLSALSGSRGRHVRLALLACLCLMAGGLFFALSGAEPENSTADFLTDNTDSQAQLESLAGSPENGEMPDTPPGAAKKYEPWAANALNWNKRLLPAVQLSGIQSRQVRVRKGDTLMGLLKREGVPRAHAHQAIVALSKNFDLRRLRAGKVITLDFSADEPTSLHRVTIKENAERIVRAELNNAGMFTGAVETIELTRETVRTGGEINDSLYLAARQLAIPHGTIIDLIHIFSFDVDFQREIRSGDAFEVYFERYADEDGRIVKEGNILFARMTLRGKEFELYRYTPEDSKRSDYFDPKGHSVRKALLRTPVDGARLTSGFGKRRHPILGYSRMHKGIDFGAKRGTPIRAAGDGTVERASRYGGYGKFIRIRHNGTYKTAYAHLNGYASGIKKGARVKQSQIIGYVGSTGRSTGPHLHYEVLKDGKHVNPLSLRLPSGRRLEGVQLTAFQESVLQLEAEIQSTPMQTLLAQNY